MHVEVVRGDGADIGAETTGARSRAVMLVPAVSRLLKQATAAMASERGSSKVNALAAFSIRLLSAAILFVSQVLLARWMGGHEFGLYVYAWTWMLILGGLASCGLNFAAIRLVAELRETGRLEELRGFLLGGRVAAFTMGLVIAGGGLVTCWLVGGGQWATGGAAAVAVMLLAVPAVALTDAQDGIGRGSARILSGLVGPYLLRPLLVLAGVGLMHAWGLELNAGAVAVAAVIAAWLAWSLQTAMIERAVARFVEKGPRAYRFDAWLKVSLPLLVIGGCDLVLQTTDIIVIKTMLSPAEAGIYFAAAKTMGLILFVHYAVGSAMANRFAAINARGDSEGLKAAAREAVRWTFWPSLAFGVALLAVGRPMLGLFGPEFVSGYPVMCVLVAGFLMRAAVGPVDLLLNMTGGQAACARTLVGVAALDVVLTLALVPVAGIVGAAVAVSVSLVLGAIINYRIATLRLGFSFGIWSMVKPLAS